MLQKTTHMPSRTGAGSETESAGRRVGPNVLLMTVMRAAYTRSCWRWEDQIFVRPITTFAVLRMRLMRPRVRGTRAPVYQPAVAASAFYLK